MSFTLAVFCWLLVLLASGAACRALFGQVFGSDRWAYVFFPGIAARRVVTVAAILLSGGTVRRASLCDQPLTGVEQEPSPVPILPGIFVAVAPLVASIWLLGQWTEVFGTPLHAIDVPGGLGSLRGFVAGLAVLLVDASEAVFAQDFADPLTWLYLYGGLNLATLLTTERDDPIQATLGLGVLLLLCGAAQRLWGGVDSWFYSLLVRATPIWSMLVLSVTLSLGMAALAGLSALLVRIVRAIRSGG